ncbi:hypothetical protein [Saccharibacillus endophyticus]|uniref:ATPase n=1 Tax=Saccharibacillus endophyticus TaxID=2060666 RepID=A0ABQ2A2K5_9BACL|nr:hypothetical protein [Saccharibacillus endophyticus]GGH84936.1 hypothetical protein GCM10007362_41180 [Saccharibacillus endophyticus]
MADFSIVIVFLSVLIGVSIVLLFSNKGKHKTDKGFQFVYYKLSYRRRMLRDLITLPFALLFVAGFFYTADIRDSRTFIAFAVLFTVIYVTFFAYNFMMWKKHEQHG